MDDHQQTTARRPSVVVVDDCSQTRKTFQAAYPALRVIATFPRVEGLLQAGLQPEVVVLDLVLRTSPLDQDALQGPAAIGALVERGHRVCVYTDERRPLVLARCLAAGANGLVRRCDPLAANQQAFLAVAAGATSIAESLGKVVELLERRGNPPELTPRQLQVLNARARGESWQGLADRLGISPKTAYDRLEAVKQKLAWHLHDAQVDPNAAPADIERALGLGPGDLIGAPGND